MTIGKYLKILALAFMLVVAQACASAPETTQKKPSTRIKTEIPPPFPITSQSLRTERIDRLLSDLVAEGSVPGLSVLIYENGIETYFGATGYSDIKNKTLLKRSDVGRYYSMTKPIVGVAMMMLYEDGKFKLDDPVSKYLPEYANMMVYAGEDEDGSMKLEPAERPMTIRDLMRHTAGFTYGFIPTPIDQMYAKNKILTFDQNLDEFSKKLATMPLLYQPGTQYNYSVSVDVQGRLIELFSGQKLGDYLEANILGPLGMTHTGFTVKAKDRAKFVATYGRDETGLALLQDGNPKLPWGLDVDRPFLEDVTFQSGGSGLVSTIDDYAKFALMLQAGGGTLITPASLALMNTDHLGDMPNGHLGEGVGFGLNFAVKTAPQAQGDYYVPEGTFYWGGMAGTAFFIDDKTDLTFIMHMQMITRGQAGIRRRMAEAIYGKPK
ncbi:MAG: beta-lactamase family protein [Robiginitomaculum sp.]|nr:beta-lactamase family protein [Robiginitomaculum sp.]